MRPRVVCLACVILFFAHATRADTLGDAITLQDGSAMEVTAGNAIQGTCRALITAGGPNLAGRQQDLYFRCNEMVTTYGLGAGTNPTANTYGYDPSETGNANRSDAIRQFSGEETSGQRRLGAQSNDLQVNAIGARMDAIRRGIRPSGSGVAMNLNGVDMGDAPLAGSYVPMGGAAGDAADADTGWAWFFNANVGSQDHDQSPNEDQYDSDYYGGTLGLDYAMENGVVFGAAFGYENYSTDIHSSGAPTQENPTSVSAGGSVDGDSYAGSLYGTYASDEWYASLIASYGTASYDLSRRALFRPGLTPSGRPAVPGFIIDRSFNADTDSHQYGAEATFGATVLSGGVFSMDGYMKVDYLSLYIDGYSEKEKDNSPTPTATPGLALTYLGQNVDTAQASLGVTLRWDFATSFGVITPYLGDEARYRFNGGSGRLHYAYTYAVERVDFASPLDNNDKVYSVVTGGVAAQLARSISVYAQYEGFLGLNNVSGGVGTIGVRGTF